jgi:hypothetical protein
MASDRPSHADFPALRAYLAEALQRGGYWRASLRLEVEPETRSLSVDVPVMIEWELPRSYERYDAKEQQRLVERGVHLLHPAYVVKEEDLLPDAGADANVRLAPLHPENWEAVQPGDQLVGHRLGEATLIEYVP